MGLGLEDLLAHLCLHLTYQYYLKLGLRGLYAIALIIHNHCEEIKWPKLIEIARSWQAEKVVALTLALASDLLGAVVPGEVQKSLLDEPLPSQIFEQAKEQLLNRQRQKIILPRIW